MNGHGPAALTGIRVLDFTEGVSGPYCTKLLADLGADVVKVERPETGEIARSMPPFVGGEPGPERSLLFHYLNTNKRSLVLDLTATGPGEELQSLLSRTDVVVENFAPGTMDRLGIGYQALSRVNPRLVLTSISNFGQTGPYRDLPASELVLSAMGGLMALSGSTSKEPIKHGLMQAHYGAGAVAAYATIAGVLQQEQSDAGCWIDVSVQEVVASELVLTEPLYAWAGGVQGRRPDFGDCLNNITECKDGHVVVQVTRAAMWSALVEMLKSEELADEKFATPTLRVANRAELDRALRECAGAPHQARDLRPRSPAPRPSGHGPGSPGSAGLPAAQGTGLLRRSRASGDRTAQASWRTCTPERHAVGAAPTGAAAR